VRGCEEQGKTQSSTLNNQKFTRSVLSNQACPNRSRREPNTKIRDWRSDCLQTISTTKRDWRWANSKFK